MAIGRLERPHRRRRISKSPVGRWVVHRRWELAAVLSLLVAAVLLYLAASAIMDAMAPQVL